MVRSLGFGLAVSGEELLENTRIALDDLADVLSGLMEVGYVESTPFSERTTPEVLPKTEYEVNSAYAHELKAALGLHRR